MKQQITPIYIRQKQQLIFRMRRARLYWRHYDRLYGWLWRAANAAGALLLFAGLAVIPVLNNFWQQNRYQLDAATMQLVGNTDESLMSQLSYSAPLQEYLFNKDGLSQTASPSDPHAALMKMQAGNGDKANESLYALELPQDFSKGVRYHDTNTGLNFSLVPNFQSLQGREELGHLVFPLDGGNQAVYTLKNNGLKEDIVVPFATSNQMVFTYTLNLPDTLEAKFIPGTGDIGVYSADPSLYGNISFGSDADQAKVMKARVNSPKNHLVFGLPAPVIKDANGIAQRASAKFELKGNTLSVVANNLRSIHGPFTIDPSVVVTSSSDFAAGGNDEDNIAFGANQINRGNLTGGTVTGGWAPTTPLSTGRYGLASVAYNGYLYVLGGFDTTYHSDVRYTSINSDGTLGSVWSSANSFGTARYQFSAQVYNGYMYILGGVSGSTYYNDVQYASIQADGSLGSWTPTKSFGTARSMEATVVYNDYMYVLGGYNGTSYYNDVQYASINADGTLGNWTPDTDSSFTNGRKGLAAAVSNGYIYVLGGSNGTSYYNDVLYAPINSDGSIGSWATTSSFTNGRYALGVEMAKGYIYIMGGRNGSSTYYNDVQYAPINANGSLGSWAATASFATARYQHAVEAYNGYLYIVGGYDGTSPRSDIQYAKIDPAGVTGAWASGTAPTTGARRAEALVAYNGYLYSIGGWTNNFDSEVLYASISNGTVGTWAATTALPSGLGKTALSAVAYNGRLYILGGYGVNCCAPISAQTGVFYVSINSNGTIGSSWTTGTSLPVANYSFSATVYNGYLYEIGGASGTTDNYALLTSTGALAADAGCGSARCPTTALTSSRTSPGAVAYGGYMYVIGGGVATVEYAQINSNGTLGSWTDNASTDLPIQRQEFALTAANGYLYVLGGYDGSTYRSDVIYAKISSSGALATDAGCGSAWCSATSFTTGRDLLGAVSYDGYIYMYGGTATTSVGPDGTANDADLQVAQINNGGPGTTGTWATDASSFNTARDSFSSVSYNNYLYVMAGSSGGTGYLQDLQYAEVTPSGALSSNTCGTSTTWCTSTASLPQGLHNPAAVVYNGFLYVIGGLESSGSPTNNAWYAKLTSSGDIASDAGCAAHTAWCQATGTLNTARYNHTAIVYNDYIVVTGGNDGTSDINTVEYAQITTAGDLATNSGCGVTWCTTTSFTNAREDHASIVANGYLYIFGGVNGSTYYNDVQSAPINSDGTVGAWSYTTSFNIPRSALTAINLNGFVYLLGGNDGTNRHNDVQYAPISSNGAVGNWQYTTSFNTGRSGHQSVVAGGFVYLLGGYNGTSGTNDVQYAALNSIPRVGHYSKSIDLGTSTTLQSITYSGLLPNIDGISKINYRAAGSDGVFGLLNSVESIPDGGGGGSEGCGGGGSGTQYVWVSITLDDSYGAIFPDAGGANVADFTVNYTANTGHPSPSIRLRGGQTLQAGTLSALDTCGT